MLLFTTEKDYTNYFWQELGESRKETVEMREYINKQIVRLIELTDNISKT
ncbi:hypothetical protein A5885_001438, partial [Enterococcus sp. 8E11_MSG4843]